MPVLKNPKHEAFVRGLLEGKSAGDAYAAAGFQSADRGNASRLRLNPKVQARLAELQEEIAGQSKITVESLIGELEQARKRATDLKQLSATIRAIEAKAKLAGLMVERSQVQVQQVATPFDGCNDMESIFKVMVDEWLEQELQWWDAVEDSDREELVQIWIDSYRECKRLVEERIEAIKARPHRKYQQLQALPSPHNGKDNHGVVTDGE